MDTLGSIKIPTPFDIGRTNCYVLDEGPLTLLDPGPDTENAWKRLTTELTALGHAVEDVERLVITHPHLDHFGAAARIKAASGATTYAHPDAVDIVGNFVDHFLAEREYFVPYLVSMGMPRDYAEIVGALPEPYAEIGTPVEIDEEVPPGETIDVGITLRAIDSPGHAEGSLTFVAEDDSLAFTGDHVLPHITPNPTLKRATQGEHARSLERYLDALRSLESVDVDRAYPGHGDPFCDLPGRIEEIIAHHDERLGRFYEQLDGGSKTAFELMQETFEGLPATEFFLGMSEVIGHLDLLRIRGEVDLVARTDGVKEYTFPA